MLNLKSVIDGFKVLLGSIIIHAASLITMITMCFTAHPPTYTGEDGAQKTESAKTLFVCLLLLHLTLAIVKYLQMFVNDHLIMINAVFMMVVVYFTCVLCKNWLYKEGGRTAPAELTPEQAQFDCWLWIELLAVMSCLCCGMVYTFLAKISPPTVNIYSPLQSSSDKDIDFMKAHTMPLELIFNFFCPMFLCIVFLNTGIYPGYEEAADRMLKCNIYYGAVQFICVAMPLFIERVSPTKSEWWIGCAPEFTYACGIASCFVMPLVSVIFNAVYLAHSKTDYHVYQPLIIFIICTQVGLLLWSLLTMLTFLNDDLEYQKDERLGFLAIYKRGRARGVHKYDQQ